TERRMKSPFPGMNPFLEDPAFWPDFHATFVGCWRECIADALPDNYEVRIFEHVCLVEGMPEIGRVREPDAVILRTRKRPIRKTTAHGGTATLAPVTIPVVFLDEQRQGYIEILHRLTRKVVAVLEL